MNEYEILLLLDPDLDDVRQDEVVARARYHLLHFTCDAGTLDEVSRVMRIDDAVLRHMATRRIQGSPVRPVAVAAATREDAVIAPDVEDSEEEG